MAGAGMEAPLTELKAALSLGFVEEAVGAGGEAWEAVSEALDEVRIRVVLRWAPALWQSGRGEEAEERLVWALETLSETADEVQRELGLGRACRKLGERLLDRGRTEEALEWVRRSQEALKADPSAPEVEVWMTACDRVLLEMKQGASGDALRGRLKESLEGLCAVAGAKEVLESEVEGEGLWMCALHWQTLAEMKEEAGEDALPAWLESVGAFERYDDAGYSVPRPQVGYLSRKLRQAYSGREMDADEKFERRVVFRRLDVLDQNRDVRETLVDVALFWAQLAYRIDQHQQAHDISDAEAARALLESFSNEAETPAWLTELPDDFFSNFSSHLYGPENARYTLKSHLERVIGGKHDDRISLHDALHHTKHIIVRALMRRLNTSRTIPLQRQFVVARLP